jgi:hypothetical protein
MIAYKFLESGRVAKFSGRVWPEPESREWLESEGQLVACRNGVHACRVGDLPYWLGPELWKVELDGKIEPSELKLVAQRGRLLERIDEWNAELRRAFAEECVRRVAMHAATELRSADLPDEGNALERAAELDAIAVAAKAAVEAAEKADARVAERVAGYAADAVEWATAYPPSGVAFVAAHAAAARSARGPDPFATERAQQARWLRERLELS